MMMQPDISKLIRDVDAADSSARLLDAVRALANAGSEQGIPTLIAALGYNNPGAAVAAVDGLIAMGEAAVIPLLEQLDGYNYGARAWAIRALSGIGDPRGLEILLKAAESDFALSVRRAAARGLGVIHWQQVAAEKVPEAQCRCLQTLLKASQDPEWVVRYAAIVGLQGLGAAILPTQQEWQQTIRDHLAEMIKTDQTLAVQARAKMAQEQMG